jgi:hypothetical protein
VIHIGDRREHSPVLDALDGAAVTDVTGNIVLNHSGLHIIFSERTLFMMYDMMSC